MIVKHITQTTATTESPTLTTNLFNTNGTINKSGVQALLNIVGTDTGTYAAHEIASNGKSIIFPMGYYVNASGTMDTSKTLYWQATYKRGGYLTIWLTQPYTCAHYNDNGTTSNSFDPGTDHSGSSSSSRYSNYSMSQLRDTTKNIYNLLKAKHTGLDSIIVAPSTSAISAWQSAQDDVYTAFSSSYYAHHNGLGTYSGDYSGWGSGTGTTWSSCLADKMWIPSVYEIFNTTTGSGNGSDTNGLWGLTATDIAYTNTRIDTGASSSSSSSTGNSQFCWLRSGYSYSFNYAVQVYSSGSDDYDYVDDSDGVRPACHISLSALKATLTTTVTLNKQSGSGGTSSVSCTGGSAMPSITIPTRTGYTFGGYYTSTNGGGTQYYTSTGASARSYPSSGGPTTLYAKWTGNTYYVKYNANGGSGTMSNSTHKYGTASNLTANAFTRTGYSFSGWATSSTGAVAYSNGASVSTLTTTSGGTYNLYAVWTINTYTITVSANNSAYGSVNGGGTYDYNTSVTLTATPNSGYTLGYWLINGVETTPTGNTYTFTATQDLTAVAYFHLASTCVTANAGGEVRISQNADGSANFNAVPYAGYYLNGWLVDGTIYTQNNATYTGLTIIISDTHKCVNAIFSTTKGATPSGATDLTNGLAVYAEFGGEARINGYASTDTTIHLSATITQNGYKFDGWYIYGESTALSTEWSVDLEKSAINNKLIVAKFSETNAQVNTETNNTVNLT
ncbi:MAG: InlB B-repeat-containing protein [Clostridia bacterium]|nr:InlB B-repeat-containing protein [Clostridia bacterium]